MPKRTVPIRFQYSGWHGIGVSHQLWVSGDWPFQGYQDKRVLYCWSKVRNHFSLFVFSVPFEIQRDVTCDENYEFPDN